MSNDELFAKIYDHITNISFGPDVYNNAEVLSALRASLPIMFSAIRVRQRTDVSVKIAYDAAFQVLHVDITRLEREDEKRLCFEASFVLMVGMLPENASLHFASVQDLLLSYPEFKDVDRAELDVLLTYRNVMRTAVMVIPAKGHKNHLLDIVTRLTEGRNQKYITGSGQKPATARRVSIYWKEGKVSPISRKKDAAPGFADAKFMDTQRFERVEVALEKSKFSRANMFTVARMGGATFQAVKPVDLVRSISNGLDSSSFSDFAPLPLPSSSCNYAIGEDDADLVDFLNCAFDGEDDFMEDLGALDACSKMSDSEFQNLFEDCADAA